MSFIEDEKQGKKSEHLFAQRLREIGFKNTFVTDGKCGIDVIAIEPDTNEIITFEVKLERKLEVSNRVCFEIKSNGQWTNLMKEVCQKIVYHVDGDFYMLDSYQVRRNLREVVTFKGGDGDRMDLHLMKLDTFKQLFNKI